jgi:ParB/RepB/Spo0J family partition protein
MNRLITKLGDAQFAGQTDLRILPLSELHPDELQPRTELEGTDTASEFRTLEGLAQSIRERGILQPLRIMKLNSGGYRIQSGHRRHAAAQMAGLQTVPCVIIQDDGDSVGQYIDQITENTQRKSMTSNEMSLAIQKLLHEGLSQADVSRKLGVNESTVSMLTRLIKLSPTIKQAFDKGLIESPRTAYDLERLPKALQEHILSQIGNMPLTQAAVREAKRAWDSNGLASRHPFQAPGIAAETFASLHSCLDDGRQDQYSKATIERDRDAFFGSGWRNCTPVVTAPPVSRVVSVDPLETVELASLTLYEAVYFIFALEKITGEKISGNPAGGDPLNAKELTDYTNALIKSSIALQIKEREQYSLNLMLKLAPKGDPD